MSLVDSIAASLQMAARTLASRSESPRLDAEMLLCKVLDVSRTALIVRSAESITDEQQRTYGDLVARRADGAPVSYLTGTREFWSLQLSVTPDVLVPRPETELLVELALALLPGDQKRSVLDLGTGSGAIALAISYHRPLASITATDISMAALAIAMQNSSNLGMSRVKWRTGSWFGAVPGQRFDLIVANPPYIAAGDPALKRLSAEPLLALSSGPTGLEALSAIIERAALHLNSGGRLLLEHGSTQAEAVADLLASHGFGSIRSHADLAGHPRVTVGSVCPSH